MPRFSSDDLFALIKSLSKAEKAFFKKNTDYKNAKGKPVYVSLYDALDKEREYSEEKILRKVKGIKPGRFSDIKNFLYNQLLNSLEHFHTSIDAEIRTKLSHTEILFERGLYKQCRKLLAKAWQIAEGAEKHLFCLLIIEWTKRIDTAEFNAANLKNAVRTFEEEKDLLNQYLNLCEYQQFDKQVTLMIRGAKLSLAVRKSKELEEIMKGRLMRDERQALSVKAKIEYLRIFSLCCYASGNMGEYARQCQKVVEQLEANPGVLDDMQGLYATSVYNLLAARYEGYSLEEIEQYIQKVKGLKAYTNEFKLWQCNIDMITLQALFENHEFEKMKELVTEMETRYKLLGDKINIDLAIRFNYERARVYIVTGQYNKALHYLNQTLNTSKPGTQFPEFAHAFAHMLRIVVHFELDNMNIIEHLIKTTYRYIYSRRKLYAFESSFLNFFLRNLHGVSSFRELLPQLPELKKELEEILKSPEEEMAFDYFDFISWLDSKIEGRPLAEVMKKTKVKHSSLR